MMQSLTGAYDTDDQVTRELKADRAAVDAVMAVSRSVAAAAMKPPGAAAEETTAAQYRALWVLASRSPWRLVDLAGALGVTQSSAGRMCGRLARKGLARRHPGRGDRRTVLVSLTAAGRQVADEAAQAFRDFADAAGEVPGSQRPEPAPAGAPVSRPRPPARPGTPVPQVPPTRAGVKERP
jgi:DNA-binding MarR family transcriptional regulator